MAPPSSGGTTVGEALNILRGWNLPAEPRATALFHYLEASRLAYADRDAYVGDPRYVSVPVRGLLSPAFAATRRCLIHDKALVSPVAPGNPHPPYHGCGGQGTSRPAAFAAGEGRHTNNIVTVDKWGNIVAYTNTINFFGGSGQTVPGYGFLLNNEMTDFDFAPPAPGAYDPNLPAGGKIPRSSMGPVIALRHGQPDFAVGAAGGATIITTILQTILNHVDFGMSHARGPRRPAGEPDELADVAGRARVLPQCRAPGADPQVRRAVHGGHGPDPAARPLPGRRDRGADPRSRAVPGGGRAGPARRRQRAGRTSRAVAGRVPPRAVRPSLVR